MNKYCFDTIKKSIVVFSKLFSDLEVTRRSPDGKVIQNRKVEIILANKEKLEKKLNSNNKRQQVVLPVLSIWNNNIKYRIDKQANPFFGNYRISKEYNEIAQYLSKGAPVDLDMSVLVKTKYYSDMMQIVETIIPMFRNNIVKSVNLIAELDIFYNITFILNNISQNLHFEMENGKDDIRSLEQEFAFTISTMIFPPIDEKIIAKQVKLFTGDLKVIGSSEQSPDDIIESRDSEVIDYSTSLVKELIYEGNNVSEIALYEFDFSAELSTHGEKIRILDEKGNDCPFVFEYDNGEWYGSDEQIPSFVSGVNKTGKIKVRANHPLGKDKPEKCRLKVVTYHHNNYQFAQNVFHIYDDFNIKTFRFIHIEKETPVDKVFVDNGKLCIKATSTDISKITKVFPFKSYSNFNRFKIGISSFIWTPSRIICGMSDEKGNYLYVETGTIDEFLLKEKRGNDITILGTITLPSILNTILFTKTGNIITTSLNGTTIGSTINKYIIPFLSGNFDVYLKYDFMYGD